jgi:hypothetical protein
MRAALAARASGKAPRRPRPTLRASRLLALGGAMVMTWALAGCAGLQPVSADQRLCEEARALARRGDAAAAVANTEKMQDLRAAWYCRNVHLRRDQGDEPNGT